MAVPESAKSLDHIPMKIYFPPSPYRWSRESGLATRWDEFIKSVPITGDKYTIVSDDSQADFVVSQLMEENFLKPLNRRDIQTFTWDFADRPTGRYSGFYCSLPTRLFDSLRHTAMSYPVVYTEMMDEFPRHEATIDFSFLGAMTAGVRVRMVEHFCQSESLHNAIVRASERRPWVFSDEARAQKSIRSEKIAFASLLRRSKFVLCPRGYGTGSFRMFEAMQAGRVPVIISDAYVRPAGIDWESCSLTIPEGRIAEIPALIQSRMDDWDILATNARKVWEDNFSPRHVMDFMATNLARMSEGISQNTFSPWRHGVRVGAAAFEERARPLAGRLKQRLRTLRIVR